MEIDHESLIEFEQGLGDSNTKDTSITLHNLEIKIEYNIIPNNDIESIEITNIDDFFKNYSYDLDEFTTCGTCGNSIITKNKCCLQYVEDSKHLSSLEKSYWLSFLNCPTRTINTLPNYSQFLFLQQGIPYQMRSIIWKKLFLINYNNQIPETSLLVYKNFQHSYNTETSDQISKDLNRTFPSIKFFSDEDNIRNLETILNVYANYDVELGYCQGLLFLVGSLYYQFKDPQLTFHALITIMESETELHDIFTQELMSITLNNWYNQFKNLLQHTDSELYYHLMTFVDLKVFLYQWWLSFMSSHTPYFSIINRIMDFCLLQGWKIGMFKISLGLLLINKPILMTMTEGDEEVIYQHLLNESKWGLVIHDINGFFGDLLFDIDAKLLLNQHKNRPMKTHKRTQSSMMDKFKNLNISSYSIPSSGSIFSRKNDGESIYSESTSESAESYDDFLKVPSDKTKMYRELLVRCMDQVDEGLRREITEALRS